MTNRRYISTRLGRRANGQFASTGGRRDGLSSQAIGNALERLHSDPDTAVRITLHHGTLDTQRKIESLEADAIRYGNKALLAIAKGNPTNARLFAKEAAHAAYLAAAQE